MSTHSIGNKSKEARLKLKLTQGEVAEKAGVHPNTYAKIERDEQEPTFATLKKLAKVLGVSIEDIAN